MTYLEAAKAPLFNPNFEGRSGRKEFWSFQLAISIALGGSIGLAFVAIEIGYRVAEPALTVVLFIAVAFLALYLLALVIVIIPWLAVCVRRLHDTNRSGAWLLVALIVPGGALVVLYFLVVESDPGANDYGPNPYLTATT